MSELNDDEIRALAKSVDLDIPDSDMRDVNYSLNAMSVSYTHLKLPTIYSV